MLIAATNDVGRRLEIVLHAVPGSRPVLTESMIGGVISSLLLELIVYPVIFEIWRGWRLDRSASLQYKSAQVGDA